MLESFFLVVVWFWYGTMVVKGEGVVVIAADSDCYYYYIDRIICDHRSIDVVSSHIYCHR